MAIRKFEKGSKEWEMFSDYWKLCQSFWIPEESDEYWKQVVDCANAFYEKYKDVDRVFCMKMTLAYVEALESRSKGMGA